MRTVAEIMSPRPATLYVEDSMEMAWQLMRQKHIRHIPVTGKDGKLVGLVTHRNLLFNTQDLSHLSLPVAEMMETDVATVSETDDLREVALKMYDRRLGCLPVLREGEIVGIVTADDFVALASKLLEAEGN